MFVGLAAVLTCGPSGRDLPRDGNERMLQIAHRDVAWAEAPAPEPVAPEPETRAVAPEPVPGNHPLAAIAIPDRPAATREPFGTPTSALTGGGMVRKWKSIQDQLPEEIALAGYCEVHPSACTRAISAFLDIVAAGRRHDGLVRIDTVNRAINRAIEPKTDQELYGVEEFWATPLQTFAIGAGDCEDYAIAKYVALKMLGVAAVDLRLLVVRDHAVNDYHAVAAIRERGHWYILDNRTSSLLTDTEIAEFDPLFTLDDNGVRRVNPTMARLRPSTTLSMTFPTKRTARP
ncbi:MAG: transglutaminase-like cysteine peptidase [Xanthobacteraceae bacterium]